MKENGSSVKNEQWGHYLGSIVFFEEVPISKVHVQMPHSLSAIPMSLSSLTTLLQRILWTLQDLRCFQYHFPSKHNMRVAHETPKEALRWSESSVMVISKDQRGKLVFFFFY